LRWIALGGGIILVASTIASVISSFVVPRDTPSRIAGWVARPFVAFFRRVSRVFKTWESKDAFLAFHAPTFVLVLLMTWLALLLLGFAAILWAVTGLDIGTAFRETASSMFTLGFATTPTPGATAVDILAAGFGLGVVALLIGYLPVLYAAFNRRERLVTLLEARAGAPAWGPEILWRHQRIGILDSIPAFYEEWERWAADVAESHSAYFVLPFFRSPHPLRSWLTGLLAVLDAAALHMALCPATAPSQARLCLRMGFTCLRTLADTFYIPYDPDPRPDAPLVISYEDFLHGVTHLQEIGFPVERTAEEAWADFRGWRVNYESTALALAELVVATPGPWMGGRVEGLTIPTKRPVDRTPDEPEGTEYTRPWTHETS
jgi:hypothetical protein